MTGPEDEIEEDVGGVQGSEPDEHSDAVVEGVPDAEGADVQAPDAGEIEWAGGLVKKAPEPG